MADDHLDMKPIDDLMEKISRDRLPDRWVRRRLRIDLGVSQEDVAKAIGVTQQSVVQWEKGREPNRFDYREKYLYFLRRASELLGEQWEDHFRDD